LRWEIASKRRSSRADIGIGAQRFDGLDMLPVVRIVHQAAQMDVMGFGQMLQYLEMADFLALVGRIGDALGEQEKIGFRCSGLNARIVDHWRPMNSAIPKTRSLMVNLKNAGTMFNTDAFEGVVAKTSFWSAGLEVSSY
jgi:hypothetical protein